MLGRLGLDEVFSTLIKKINLRNISKEMKYNRLSKRLFQKIKM
jgi:hypothetical protein